MTNRHSRPVWRAFSLLLSTLMRDHSLAAAFIVPLLLGGAFRYGLPALIASAPALAILNEHIPLGDALLYLITPLMGLLPCCMVILDERDSGTALGLITTPLGASGYLISRLMLPLAFVTVYTAGIASVFSSANRDLIHTLILAVPATFTAFSACIFIPAIARNKVSGMSMTKVSVLLMLTVIIPFFVPMKWEPYLSWLPTYWFYRYLQVNDWLMALLCIAVSSLWIVPCLFRAKRRLAN